MDRFHVTSWYKISEFLKTFHVEIGQVFPQALYPPRSALGCTSHVHLVWIVFLKNGFNENYYTTALILLVRPFGVVNFITQVFQIKKVFTLNRRTRVKRNRVAETVVSETRIAKPRRLADR
jgi:hypothetical protein